MPASSSDALWLACRDLLGADGAGADDVAACDLAAFLVDDVVPELQALIPHGDPREQADYAIDAAQLRYREAHALMTGTPDPCSATDPVEFRAVLQSFVAATGIALALRRAAICDAGAALLSALVRDTVRHVLWTVVVEADAPVSDPARVALKRLLPVTRALRAKLDARTRLRRCAA